MIIQPISPRNVEPECKNQLVHKAKSSGHELNEAHETQGDAALIADALVLVFTYGISLQTWKETGGIDRELEMYWRLRPFYRNIYLVSFGGPGDIRLMQEQQRCAGIENTCENLARVHLICNQDRLPVDQYAHRVPEMVCRALQEARCATAVVKTNQMSSGRVAVAVTKQLRNERIETGLVARGGYLWSQMEAYKHGPASAQARHASDIERDLLDHANILVGTTAAMVEDLSWRYHVDPQRCVIIPNYTLAGDGQPPAAEDREKGLVLFAGQLIERKRVDVLIEAMSLLEPEMKQRVTLEIVGDGPLLESLEALAAASGAKVRFVGRLSHQALLERMKACSIYAQASELEGHPKTILEALSCGAPVVVSNTPGQAETISHGVTGLRLPLDAAAFSKAISELIEDPSWRDMLGSSAARWARSILSIDVVIRQERAAHQAALVSSGKHALQQAA